LLEARAQYHMLARDYSLDRSEEIVRQAPSVIANLSRLGMHQDALRARLIIARALKFLGRDDEASAVIEIVHTESVQLRDTLVEALSLCDRAELLNRSGDSAASLGVIPEALEAASRSGCEWAVADVEATCGEILRDAGHLGRAIEAYDAAVRMNESIGMESKTAYLRVLLAETMLMAGQPGQAASQILAALPVIDRNQLTREAIAAVGILRESILRQTINPGAIRALREQLQRMHEQA
jgi:hypothetical protein